MNKGHVLDRNNAILPHIGSGIALPTLVLLLGFLAIDYPATSFAADRCCARCGCHDQVAKVCRIVREEKKIAVTCWGVQQEDFCIGGPSCPGCEHCELLGKKDGGKKDGTGKADAKVASEPKRLTWTHWIPSQHASVFSKKKLMKRSITKSVPSFRWVIEDLCDKCKKEPQAVKKKVQRENQ